MKAGILTFHATPNFGAVLQAHALQRVLCDLGAQVEIINYVPLGALAGYGRSLFLGPRGNVRANIDRIRAFRRFFRQEAKLSGPAMFGRRGLARIAQRYDIVFVGSDEVWKVDHLRRFDPAFYLDFLDPSRTRLCAYGASIGPQARVDRPNTELLLERFHAISVRDPWTGRFVHKRAERRSVEVLDPTLLVDWPARAGPASHGQPPYIALYGWPDAEGFRALRTFARQAGLEIRCVGCHHRGADASHLGIGPLDWVEWLRHSALIVTDHFHGLAFALALGVAVFTYADPAKCAKLAHLAGLAGLPLADAIDAIEKFEPVPMPPVARHPTLEPLRARSLNFLAEQLSLVTAR